jgi:hypothetical protein
MKQEVLRNQTARKLPRGESMEEVLNFDSVQQEGKGLGPDVDSVIAWQRFCDHARKDHHVQNTK